MNKITIYTKIGFCSFKLFKIYMAQQVLRHHVNYFLFNSLDLKFNNDTLCFIFNRVPSQQTSKISPKDYTAGSGENFANFHCLKASRTFLGFFRHMSFP